MKKILELAEKMRIAQKRFYTKSDGVPRKVAYADLKTKEQLFDTELARRWRLKQTPITEDWLKEHGWRQCGQYGHQFVHPKCFFWLFGLYGFTCWEIIKTEYTAVGEKSCVFCEITTVAQLLDALELCNINID